MYMDNKVSNSSFSLNLYAPPNPVKNRNRCLPEDKFIKVQKADNTLYLTKQIFHAVQHGYLDFLETVPRNVLKKCLNELYGKNCFSLLHFAVLENHKDVILYLLTFDPDINIVASKKLRPIHLAAQKGHVEIVELLCNQKKLSIDATDDKGQTALQSACRRGYHDVVKILLIYGACVNKVEYDKMSLMHHPVRRNDLKMVQILLPYNAPVTNKNTNGQNPIMIAVIEGHNELFNILIEKVIEEGLDVTKILNEKDNDGHSCISNAVQIKNAEIIKQCMYLGANIKDKQLNGKTIFHTAAIIEYETLFDIIDMDKIDLNVTDNDLNTPLHEAVFNNSIKMVKLLIKHGVNINVCNRKFQTPLLLACTEISSVKNLFEIIKILIGAKANMKIRDIEMKNVIHHLVEKESTEILNYIIQVTPKPVQLELINSQDESYNSPLHYASRMGNFEICKALLDAGADTKLFAENDYLPLHLATMNGHLEVAKLLLDVDLETGYFRDRNETAVIHLAAEHGKYEIFRYLIEYGKDSFTKDEFGRNTLMFAARSGCLPIVEYLLESDINVNLHDQMKTTALHQAARHGHLKIVQCLWHHGAVLHDTIYGQTAFDLAIINRNNDIIRFFLNDANWKICMDYRHKDGSSHIETLIKYNEEITLELLDHCIVENTTNKMDPNYEIKYWFEILDAGPRDSSSVNKRYYALQTMAKFKTLSLLKHPLSLKLLEIKWETWGYIFYIIDLILYLIYLVSISVFVAKSELVTNSDLYDSSTGCKISSLNSTKEKELASPELIFTNTLVFGVIIIRIVVHGLKLLEQKSRYFKDMWNVISVLGDILTLYFVNDPQRMPCLKEWVFGPPLMFISYVYLLYYFQHLPIVGIHVIMFQRVLETMTKVLVSFACVMLGFAFGFYIINSEEDPFKNPGVAMIKTSAMMIGEIDLVPYFITGKKNYLTVSYVMISLFILIVPLTLFNLIIGLAVGDIGQVASEAILEAFRLKIEYVWEVESKFPLCIQQYFYRAEYFENPTKKQKSTCQQT